jgi:hypothetical protein
MLLCSFPVSADESEHESKMSLEERVNQSELIVVGKLGRNIYMSGNNYRGPIQIEEVLLGTVPTNKVLHAYYKATLWLIPRIAAGNGIKPDKDASWILFLNGDVNQPSGSNYLASVVGEKHYAQDGLVLAEKKTIKQVKALISKKPVVK